ncbi:MAG TPA: hypothetical protein VK655_04525 [Solirubrobacteraceae bacterium]|jgi:hypothetical protein|nr:hypothetical protein [Solirubrobacteraceae bacterium]
MATETATDPATEVQELLDAPAEAAPEAKAAAKKVAKSEPQAKDAKKAGKSGKAEKAEKAKKGKKGKKGKDAQDGEGEQPDGGAPSIAAHPRAARAVARAKGWGGLAGFVLAGYMALPTNTLAAAGLRALIAGVVCYVVTWAGAVFLWRRLVMLEIKGREQQLLASANAARAPRELPAGSAERPSSRAAS